MKIMILPVGIVFNYIYNRTIYPDLNLIAYWFLGGLLVIISEGIV